MGLIDLIACPHTRNEPFRLSEFKQMMMEESGVGIGLDDCAAIQIRDDEYRVIASDPDSSAHVIYRTDGEIVHETIRPHDDFRPLTDLLLKHM
jgi:hypothetical protein